MSQYYYNHHLFICQNVRDDGRRCCNADGRAERLRQYAKDRADEWGLKSAAGVRVNQAGCLGRCSQGPLLVIYPAGVWYRYESEEDIDEILLEHVMNGNVVERLAVDHE